MLESIQTAMI